MGTTAYGGKGSKGRAANGDRPVGAASCRRDHHTMASCQPPPPLHASRTPLYLLRPCAPPRLALDLHLCTFPAQSLRLRPTPSATSSMASLALHQCTSLARVARPRDTHVCTGKQFQQIFWGAPSQILASCVHCPPPPLGRSRGLWWVVVGCVRWRPSVVGGLRTDDDGGSASRPAPAPPPPCQQQSQPPRPCANPPPPRGLLEGEGALGANSEQLQSGWGAL